MNPFEEEADGGSGDTAQTAHPQKPPKLWVKLKSIIRSNSASGKDGGGKARFSFRSPFQTLSRKNSEEENLSLRKSSISSLEQRGRRSRNKKELTEKVIGEGKMGQVEQEQEEEEEEEVVVSNGASDEWRNREGNERSKKGRP